MIHEYSNVKLKILLIMENKNHCKIDFMYNIVLQDPNII